MRATRAVVRCARAARRGAFWRVQSCLGSAGELCEGVESDVAEAVDDDDKLLLLCHLALLQRVLFLQGVASLLAARRRARRRLLLELSSSLSSSSSASLSRSLTRAKHNALHCPLHHKLYCPLYTGLRFSANLRACSRGGQRSLLARTGSKGGGREGDARAQALEAVLGLQDRLVREALDVEARLAAGGRARGVSWHARGGARARRRRERTGLPRRRRRWRPWRRAVREDLWRSRLSRISPSGTCACRGRGGGTSDAPASSISRTTSSALSLALCPLSDT